MALRTEEAVRTSSLGEAVLDEDPERDHTVAPRNLLALFVTTPVVRDWHLVHAVPALEDLRRYLRLDAEAVAVERKRPEHFDPHRFVAGLHVGQRGVVEDVGQKGEEPI